MKIYLDNCVLNRPFDDQTQERIYLETQAFLIILRFIEEKKIELVSSIANIYEIDKMFDYDRKSKLHTFLSLSQKQENLNLEVEKRTYILNEMGFIGMDSLHLAFAENLGVEYFVTCDDKLLRKATKNKDKLNIKILSIFEFIEVIYHVKNN